MLAQFTKWLIELVKSALAALWDFITDAAVWFVDQVVGVLVSMLAAVPVPAFMQGGLQQLFGGLDGPISWAVAQLGIPQALGILGAAYVFRLARKVVTLFQW